MLRRAPTPTECRFAGSVIQVIFGDQQTEPRCRSPACGYAVKFREICPSVEPHSMPDAPLQPRRSTRKLSSPSVPLINLQRYVPAYLTWIANKLSRGASQHYLAVFNVGIETWRCLVLLANEGQISAQRTSQVIGMDKASVSRTFKNMQSLGLITFSLDNTDGRLRLATLTKKGRALHDQIIGVALERERVLLEVLTVDERETLINLLRRLHENLPEVEAATTQYLSRGTFQSAEGNTKLKRVLKSK